MRGEAHKVLSAIAVFAGADGFCEASIDDLCAASGLPANVVRFSISALQQHGYLSVFPQWHGVTTYALTPAAKAAFSTRRKLAMSINKSENHGTVPHPAQQSTVAPIVNGAATSGSLHGGSVTVHRAPEGYQQDRGSVSPLVDNSAVHSI
jgi:hypothetical protein